MTNSVRTRTVAELFAGIAAAWLIAAFAWAAEEKTSGEKEKNAKKESSEAISLGEIVVTATRRPIALRDAPANVTVLGKDDIANSPARTADDLLESVVGVDTLESDLTEKTKRSVRLRGVPDQGKTLVLLDGMPLNWPIHGDVDWNAVPLESIDRIEVVRGPVSSLYGSHAMGGVIQILTRPPGEGFDGNFTQSYGSLDTWTSALNLGGRDGDVGYCLHGRYINSDGYYSSPDPLTRYSTRNARETYNLGGRLYWFPDDDSSLTLGGLVSDSDRNRGREFDNSHRQTAGSYLTYNRNADEGIDWLSTIYWHNSDYRTEFDKRPTYNCIEHIEDKLSSHWGGMVQGSLPVSERNTLTAGIEYRQNGFNQEDRYLLGDRYAESDGRQQYWSVYGQDEMALVDDRVLVTLGLRADWWRSYDGSCRDTSPSGGVAPYDDDYDSEHYSAFNPKLGLVYHLTDATAVRSSVGRGFQAPNVFRMYRSFQRGSKFYLSNPDLEPETLTSYELGADHQFSGDLLARVTLYDSYGSDFIGNRRISGNTYQVDNFTEVRMLGVEADLEYRITHSWSCSANYTYSEATIEKNDPDPTLEGNYLENSPRNKVSAGLTYNNPELVTASVLLRYVDEMYVESENDEELDDYTTVDIKLQREIDRFTFSASCENIFDEEYEIPDHDVQKAPGRFWTFSVGYDL